MPRTGAFCVLANRPTGRRIGVFALIEAVVFFLYVDVDVLLLPCVWWVPGTSYELQLDAGFISFLFSESVAFIVSERSESEILPVVSSRVIVSRCSPHNKENNQVIVSSIHHDLQSSPLQVSR